MRVLRAEEGVSLLDRIENAEGARGTGGRLAKLFELVMRPVHEPHLPIELVLAGCDHLFQLVAFAKFLELWIIVGIEFEPPREFAFHQRQRIQAPHRGLAPILQLRRRSRTELNPLPTRYGC
jgi:hypothetical protein